MDSCSSKLWNQFSRPAVGSLGFLKPGAQDGGLGLNDRDPGSNSDLGLRFGRDLLFGWRSDTSRGLVLSA